jgi:hypothetical protein
VAAVYYDELSSQVTHNFSHAMLSKTQLIMATIRKVDDPPNLTKSEGNITVTRNFLREVRNNFAKVLFFPIKRYLDFFNLSIIIRQYFEQSHSSSAHEENSYAKILSITSSRSNSFNFVKGRGRFNNSTTGFSRPSFLMTKQPFRGFVGLIVMVYPFSFRAFSILAALVLNADL